MYYWGWIIFQTVVGPLAYVILVQVFRVELMFLRFGCLGGLLVHFHGDRHNLDRLTKTIVVGTQDKIAYCVTQQF